MSKHTRCSLWDERRILGVGCRRRRGRDIVFIASKKFIPGKNGLLTLIAELLNFTIIKVDTQIDYY
jgi:hypothetical protein